MSLQLNIIFEKSSFVLCSRRIPQVSISRSSPGPTCTPHDSNHQHIKSEPLSPRDMNHRPHSSNSSHLSPHHMDAGKKFNFVRAPQPAKKQESRIPEGCIFNSRSLVSGWLFHEIHNISFDCVIDLQKNPLKWIGLKQLFVYQNFINCFQNILSRRIWWNQESPCFYPFIESFA